jgi:hypothetical protein
MEQAQVCEEDMPTIVWEALFARSRARLKRMPDSLLEHWPLFTLDTGICLTYIPEKLSMCYYITHKDRKGDTAHVQ